MESRQGRQKTSAQTGGRSGSGRVITQSDLLNSCFRILSVRPRSTAEIRKFLQAKTSDTDLINQIIARLTNLNFLDDIKFAQWLVASRSRSRPRGNRLLVRELTSKGIDPTTIQDNLMTGDSELSLAKTALLKKYDRWKLLSFRDFRVKAGRFLASRGFSWEVIERAVKEGYNEPHVS